MLHVDGFKNGVDLIQSSPGPDSHGFTAPRKGPKLRLPHAEYRIRYLLLGCGSSMCLSGFDDSMPQRLRLTVPSASSACRSLEGRVRRLDYPT